MEQVPVAGLSIVGRVSLVLLVTGGIVVIYGALRLFGIVPRRSFISQSLDPKVEAIVTVVIGIALVILGFVFR